MVHNTVVRKTAAVHKETLKRKEILARYEAEELNEIIAKNSPVSIYIVQDGRFCFVNPQFQKTSGYSEEELLGLQPLELVHPEDRQRVRDHAIAMLKGQILTPCQFRIFHRDGEIRWGVETTTSVTYRGRKASLGIFIDITESKQMERALQESEEKFSKAFRASPESITIVTVKDEKYIDINDSYTKMTGYSREELIGNNAFSINLWVNDENHNKMHKMMREQGRIYNEEFDYRTKSGEIRTRLFSLEPITINGEPCTIGVSIDITERKMMEKALRESEEKFSKAFRASPQVISISRVSDGVFKEINESFCRVLGYSREEVIGHSSKELGLWVKTGDREDIISRLKKHGRVSSKEYLFRTKSGEIRTMLYSADQIELDGEPCVLAVTIDITDYKRMETQALEAENLKQVDKLRTELLANVSHELRTPLTSIKGFATMLMDYDKRLTSAEKREYLETIDKNADGLVELIEQLLEMSRLGAGMLSIKKAPTDIVILCQTAINEARIRAPGHIFTLDLTPQLPKMSIDDRRIRQVLDHIIDNAVKYSNPGTEITLSVKKNNNDILFTVTDHGIGIPKSDLPRVFNRMFHSTLGQKTGVAGAGLGLAICKGLIEAHGGKIWLESEEGVGTKCFFTLPQDSASEGNDTGKSNRKKQSVRR